MQPGAIDRSMKQQRLSARFASIITPKRLLWPMISATGQALIPSLPVGSLRLRLSCTKTGF